MSINTQLSHQHRSCDQLLMAVERAVHGGDWPAAAAAMERFSAATLEHFQLEEAVLFPALMAATPMAAAPTAVMRSEHEQMRQLFLELADAVAARDSGEVRDILDTLLLLVQQHNSKEEAVLYPIADRLLADDLLARSGS